MSVARNILKHPKLVPGGGATELTVSATLKQKSSSIEGIEKVNMWDFMNKEFENTANLKSKKLSNFIDVLKKIIG